MLKTTKAKAKGRAKALAKHLGKGWKIRIWNEELGLGNIRTAVPTVSVCYHAVDAKPGYAAVHLSVQGIDQWYAS